MDVAASLNGALRRVPTWAVYGLGLVPLAVLVWRALSGGLGIDPVKTLEHQLGLTALQLLLAGLLVTPLRRWTGVNLIR
ncbi:MAG: sulfoxide reductase heme-binding subunit YedZ, partial [Rhodobacter sp.]